MIDEAIDTIKAHIVRTPGVLGGKPRIAGHRIAVQHVVVWHDRMGMSVDDIANEYGLSPADIHAALAYYHDHQDEINTAIRAEEMFVTEMQQRYPSRLKAKLGG
ncbi:MAG: DUF433 domain-containing protein [Roseiflexaceae bacterium]